LLYLVYGISGGTVGKTEGPHGERLDVKGPIADLDRLNWADRSVIIVFDSDVRTNEKLRIARYALAKELRTRGARVLFLDIPNEAGAKGVDDLIGIWEKDRVLDLLTGKAYDPKASTAKMDEPKPNGAARCEGWSTTQSKWPDELTAGAFHCITGELVRMIEPHSEADPAALLLQFLASFGNVIGRQSHFMAEADRHFMNLFVVIVGQTSKGRKGTSLGQIQRILAEVDPVWSETRVMGGLASGEGLIWAERDEVRDRVPAREKGRIVRYEEQISDDGEKDKRLLLVEPEFSRVLSVAERESNTLSAIIRQAWDTGNLRILTKKQAARSTEAHISIIGHITKDEVRRQLTNTAAANGFANRFLWVCARRSKLLAEGGALHTVDVAPFCRRLQIALEFAERVNGMRRDDQARDIWREVYPDLSGGKTGFVGCRYVPGRSPNYAT
jgi:hypothetical protein